jgi:3,5-epimerase/4-reductase
VPGKARCDDYDSFTKEIKAVNPDRIFSSVGRTHGTDKDGKVYTTIDFLELPGNQSVNIQDNLQGPLNLARAAEAVGIHCAYMGTGCIFEYDNDKHPLPTSEPIDYSTLKGFTETDRPNFFGSGYSLVKGLTDQAMHLYENSVLNWRIRMPISAATNSRDFVTKISTYAKVCSIYNSMTVLPEILPIMVHMMEHKVTGTFNMCNPGLVSHNQILAMYKELVDPAFTWTNFTQEEQAKILRAGRSNNYLETSKLEQYCATNGLTLSPIKDAVEATLKHRRATH